MCFAWFFFSLLLHSSYPNRSRCVAFIPRTSSLITTISIELHKTFYIPRRKWSNSGSPLSAANLQCYSLIRSKYISLKKYTDVTTASPIGPSRSIKIHSVAEDESVFYCVARNKVTNHKTWANRFWLFVLLFLIQIKIKIIQLRRNRSQVATSSSKYIFFFLYFFFLLKWDRSRWRKKHILQFDSLPVRQLNLLGQINSLSFSTEMTKDLSCGVKFQKQNSIYSTKK